VELLQQQVTDLKAALEQRTRELQELRVAELTTQNHELKRLVLESQMVAVTDELTQVYNRRGLLEIGAREVARARRFGHPLTALMVDIDHFKSINDNLGHLVGDVALSEVAHRMRSLLRQVDLIGRFGGEEFAVLLPETDLRGGTLLAERLRLAVAQPMQTDGGQLQVTISVGVAALDPAQSLHALIDEADARLLRAKELGRNRVVGLCNSAQIDLRTDVHAHHG
jgi:diguanylate cyclase (GGDEF)-like protein